MRQKKRGGEKKQRRNARNTKVTKIVDINPVISIIILNVSGLKTPIKRQR